MKHRILTGAWLAAILLAGCTSQPSTPVQTTTNNTAKSASVSNLTESPATSVQAAASNATEKAEIDNLVGNFGKKLQAVSLLAPDAAQQIQTQYADFVSPTLLQAWMNDVSKAPGRMVSSPWPDHIEITALAKEDPDKYVITGSIVEMTSVEVTTGGAANKIPVRIIVQRDQARWLITEYAEEP